MNCLPDHFIGVAPYPIGLASEAMFISFVALNTTLATPWQHLTFVTQNSSLKLPIVKIS